MSEFKITWEDIEKLSGRIYSEKVDFYGNLITDGNGNKNEIYSYDLITHPSEMHSLILHVTKNKVYIENAPTDIKTMHDLCDFWRLLTGKELTNG